MYFLKFFLREDQIICTKEENIRRLTINCYISNLK